MRGPKGVAVAAAGRRSLRAGAAMRALAGEASVANDMSLSGGISISSSRRSTPCRRRWKSRRTIRNRSACAHALRLDRRQDGGYVARAPASPRQDGRARASLLVRRRRLRRSARRFLWSLQPQHQLNQLVLAQPLQISPVHRSLSDSEISLPGKGVGNYSSNVKDGIIKNLEKLGRIRRRLS